LLAGCGPASTSRAVIRLPLEGAFNPDPTQARTIPQVWVDSLLYDGLVKFDPSMHVVPDLAVALPSISNDGTEYDFTIRSGVRFADGRALSAADVVFSLNRALLTVGGSESSGSTGVQSGALLDRAPSMSEVLSVRSTGLYGIRIRLSRPDSAFLAKLALPASSVLDRTAVRAGGRWWLRGAGTGGFVLHKVDRDIWLTANPHYFDGQMRISGIELLPTRSASGATRLSGSDRLDATPVRAASYAKLSANPEFSWTDTTRVFYLNLSALPSGDERTALDQALDRSRISLLGANVDPSTTIVPPTVPDYPAISDPYSYDPIAAAGILRGTKFHLTGSAMAPPQVVGWLLQSWRRAGARIHIRQASGGTVSVFQDDILLPDAGLWLSRVGRNLQGESSKAAFDQLVQSGDAVDGSANPIAQDSLLNSAEGYLLQHSFVVPLAIEKQGYLIAPRLHGLTPTPIGLEPANDNWSSITWD
ncbi:MAG TPA: ABC transporter substrate-binding protein, partial [Chloroflexota bacterium]|nr:ABC transporter substrate-binding protein [Chloroflexota bacterium]